MQFIMLSPTDCRRIALRTASASVIGYCVYSLLKSVDWRGTLSMLCEELASEPDISPDLARDAFASTVVDPCPPTRGHTHPVAAAARTSATNFVRSMSSYCGVSLYVVQMSRSDQRKGLRGSRQWHWSKDTNVRNRHDVPLPDDIEYICDVDYYMDMPDLLALRAKPTVLYTVVPEAASSVGVDDSTIFFESDGSLTTLVAGGGSYNHHLWDYRGDSLIAVRKSYGVVVGLVTYAVERKQVATNRQLVLLTPIKRFWGVGALLASCILDGPRLVRFNPIVQGADGSLFVRFGVHTASGTMVTTGRPDTTLSATIDSRTDAALAGVARVMSSRLPIPTTQSWLPKEQSRQDAVVLTEFFRQCEVRAHPIVYPLELSVRTYQYEPRSYDADARSKLQAFMSPLIHGAFAPAHNAASERRCVQGRIVGLRKEEPKPNAFRDQCIEEFASLVLQGAHLAPVCFDTVAAKQTRPAQVLSLLKASVAGPLVKRVLKCFLKSEAYPDVKDPRNISTYNDSDKLLMSQFALSLSEHCKQFPWYGPGKTPIEIAQRVADICMNAQFVNVSDYHRMDGTISYVLRLVDRVVMMKAYHHHREELNELLKRNVDNVGVLPNGTSFEQGSSHGSGCPATSVFQTLRAAFTAYLAFRHAVSPTGGRNSPAEAFDFLGIHLGDDGLDADLRTDDLAWSCSKVGLVLEASIVYRGDRGVSFLARYYSPDVWSGSLDSMCDVKRQLSKFHTTVRLPESVSPQAKLVEKARSYVATDPNTPVIGELCGRVLMLSGNADAKQPTLGVGTWWSRFDRSVQYPNNNVGGWMDVEFSVLLAKFDRVLFRDWLASCRSLAEILEAPICQDVEPASLGPVEVVVDQQVVPAREASPPSSDSSGRSEPEDSTRSRSSDRDKRGRTRKRMKRVTEREECNSPRRSPRGLEKRPVREQAGVTA